MANKMFCYACGELIGIAEGDNISELLDRYNKVYDSHLTKEHPDSVNDHTFVTQLNGKNFIIREIVEEGENAQSRHRPPPKRRGIKTR